MKVNVVKSIRQLGLKYGQVNLKAILTYLVILSTGLVIGFANGSSRSQPPVGAIPNAENLKPLASFAGKYATWADA